MKPLNSDVILTAHLNLSSMWEAGASPESQEFSASVKNSRFLLDKKKKNQLRITDGQDFGYEERFKVGLGNRAKKDKSSFFSSSLYLL